MGRLLRRLTRPVRLWWAISLAVRGVAVAASPSVCYTPKWGKTTMISEDEIRAAVAILVREAQPERVILFGSYARGDAKPDSDLDLLVVEREVRHQQAEMARLRR